MSRERDWGRSKRQDMRLQEILARKLLVQYEDHRRTMIDESDIVTVVNRNSKTVESS